MVSEPDAAPAPGGEEPSDADAGDEFAFALALDAGVVEELVGDGEAPVAVELDALGHLHVDGEPVLGLLGLGGAFHDAHEHGVEAVGGEERDGARESGGEDELGLLVPGPTPAAREDDAALGIHRAGGPHAENPHWLSCCLAHALMAPRCP